MREKLLRVAMIFVCLLAFAASAAAQGGGATSTLAGVVSDTTGAVIPGATVSVRSNATGTQFEAVTNEQGYFSILAVNPGGYTVTVTLAGFKTAVLNNVQVNAATPASVRVTLEVGGIEETVMVSSGSEIVQTQSAAVMTTLDVNQISKLPTGSRNVLDFITTLPGVNTPAGNRDSRINGLPQSSINITIDGMSAQDNWLKTTDGFFARVNPRLDAMEEVTVSTAAQDAANTGQGAVQIRFVTRSGTNNFLGSSYYYLRHHKLNANTWFNNRDLPPGPDGKAPKNEDRLFQPGTRVGGPIIIPGLWNGRNKGFFFVNYEESRSPGQNSENRIVLHPRAEQGIFRYSSGGQIREVDLLALAGRSGFESTIDPIIGRVLRDIRNAVTGTGGLVDRTDPLQQQFTYQYDTESVTRYPTARVDFNLNDKHRLTGSMNYTDLLSTPDTTNNREPNFPGFPGTGNQHSDRYTVQGTLRSTLSRNVVNELRSGRTGGATLFSPEIGINQFQGTPVADQGGFFLDINGDFLGITNPHSTRNTSAREAGTRVVENTLNWLKGSHNIQIGAAFTRAVAWVRNQQQVPEITFGVAPDDPAQALFTPANFPGASSGQLNDARELYATLTGRIIGIEAEARLDENTDEYRVLGLGVQRARLHDWGFFIADTWRWRPNFTLFFGLRYELQEPFTPENNSYSKASLDDICGISGVAPNGSCNLFQPGTTPGRVPQFVQFNEGEGAYKTDRNNFAPSLGFAWSLGGNSGLLGSVLGSQEGDSVLRGGYTLAYDRLGMSTFATTIDNNPGISISADRNHALGNLGQPGTIFLRNPSAVAPASVPATRVYPMTDLVTGDITAFHPNLQVPYSQTWTAGWQRKLTSDMAIEARYVGSRSLQSWETFDFNEVNIVENRFLDEFRRAQQNLLANVAAGRGNTFAFTGAPGTAPLPIFLAYFNARTDASNPLAYSGGNWTNSTFRSFLAIHNPDPFGLVTNDDDDGIMDNATLRANALRAGLPANFFVANPHYLGGADLIVNGGDTKYNSFQLELRKRLSHGLQFQSSYVFGKAYESEQYSFRRPRRRLLDTGAEGGVTHAFKANWTYELPFGQGRRFAGSAGSWMDRLIGGWSFDGIARIQSGRMLDFGNVRLVGMSVKDFQKAFKLRFDHAGKAVFMLPQDIVENTVKAFSVTPTGYSSGAPEGRYLAPANTADCIEVAAVTTDADRPALFNGYGECGLNNLVVTGPRLVRFDLSAVKRVQIKGRLTFEFRAEFLNAFNTPWFTPVTWNNSQQDPDPNSPDVYRVTTGDTSREVQLIWRLNW
jgi:hypothetical protein